MPEDTGINFRNAGEATTSTDFPSGTQIFEKVPKIIGIVRNSRIAENA
jgi:hypothetical protein